MAEEMQRPSAPAARWAIAIAVVALTLALLVPRWASSPTKAPVGTPSAPAPAAQGAASAATEDSPRLRAEAAATASRTITLIATFAGPMQPPSVLEARCRLRPGDRDTTPSITGDRVALHLPSADWAQLDVALSGSNFMPSRQLVLPADVDAKGFVRVLVKPRSTLTLRALDPAGAGVANLRLILAPNRSGAAREPVADLEVTTDALGAATLPSIARYPHLVNAPNPMNPVLLKVFYRIASEILTFRR